MKVESPVNVIRGAAAMVKINFLGTWRDTTSPNDLLLGSLMIKLLFITCILPLSCCFASGENNVARVRNIVLVHGAWADGSGWKGVHDILVKDDYKVSIVQEPETSFKEDVAATKRVLALQDGPCILVAHSYGGAVITEAGTDPLVVSLVYIAAHMPDVGENEAEDGKRFPSDLSKSNAIKKTADGGMRHEPRVTGWKFQARATPFTSPDQRRLQHSSNKLHHTLVRNGPHNVPAKNR